MKKVRKVLTKLKKMNEEVFLKEERITIVDREKFLIQNYQEIAEITDKEIRLKTMRILGNDLKIMSISKYFLEVNGKLEMIVFGDNHEK